MDSVRDTRGDEGRGGEDAPERIIVEGELKIELEEVDFGALRLTLLTRVRVPNDDGEEAGARGRMVWV